MKILIAFKLDFSEKQNHEFHIYLYLWTYFSVKIKNLDSFFHSWILIYWLFNYIDWVIKCIYCYSIFLSNLFHQLSNKWSHSVLKKNQKCFHLTPNVSTFWCLQEIWKQETSNAFNNCVALFLAIKCSIKRNQPNQNDIITDEMSVWTDQYHWGLPNSACCVKQLFKL